MLLSELAIIYIAAAAPFGVGHFLSRRARDARHARSAARAAAAALAWPLTALLMLRRAAARDGRADASEDDSAPDERKVERARRATVGALLAVEDALAERGHVGDAARQALFAARECVERYAGLSLACAGARREAAPTPREMELCRIAGRAGDDLLDAGRCVHRRNVTRLLAHRERARAELVHALAEVRELTHKFYPPTRPPRPAGREHEGRARQIEDEGRAKKNSEREQTSEATELGRASEALLRALARAVDLLSLFDDGATAAGVARLLEAERARLRRLEAAGAGAAGAALKGEESCTTRAAHTAFATPRLPTPTSRRG